MEQYVIKGGNPLYGEVEIGGAKNAALAILAAAIMTDETVTIDNLPNVRDINVLLQAIEEIGAHVERVDIHKVKINGSFIRGVKCTIMNSIQTNQGIILFNWCITWKNTSMQRLRFREAVISEAGRLTFI